MTVTYENIVEYDEIIDGAAGNDLLNGTAGNDYIQGYDGDDSLFGFAGDDYIDAGAGNDYVDGGTGNNTLAGGNGVDTAGYFSAAQGVSVDLSLGRASHADGTDILINFENVYGSNFGDAITGNFWGNALYGNGGNDILSGGDGDDWLDGGTGNDTASYADSIQGVIVSLVTGTASGAGYDTLVSIENVNGSAFGDSLTGDAGSNALYGNGGNDALAGGLGDDTLDGGAGIDTVKYFNAVQGITADLTNGWAYGEGNDVLLDIENLYSSNFSDYLVGNYKDNIFVGNDGDDQIFGGDGNDQIQGDNGNDMLFGDNGYDTLVGGIGNDTLYGGDGDDLLSGGAGEDTVSCKQAKYFVVVNLTTGIAREGIDTDTLNSIENVFGSDFNDILTGNTGDNKLFGNNGRDTLYGEAGSDLIDGGAGADELYGGVDNEKDVFQFDSAYDSTSYLIDKMFNFVSGVDKIDLGGIDANTALSGDQAFASGLGTAWAANGLWIVADAANNLVTLYGDIDGKGGSIDGTNGAEFAVMIVGVTTIAAVDIIF